MNQLCRVLDEAPPTEPLTIGEVVMRTNDLVSKELEDLGLDATKLILASKTDTGAPQIQKVAWVCNRIMFDDDILVASLFLPGVVLSLRACSKSDDYSLKLQHTESIHDNNFTNLRRAPPPPSFIKLSFKVA